MRGFRKLVMLGVLLVTLLLVSDMIDAGKKQRKKKEIETEKSFDREDSKFTSKNKHSESLKHDKVKKSGSHIPEYYDEGNRYEQKGFESKKPDMKTNAKFASKEKKYTEKEKIITSKQFQKLKKTKIVEEDPMERFEHNKMKSKKTKPQYLRSDNIEKIIKTVKKTTQKKRMEENENFEKNLGEELNKLKNEDTISVEETTGGNQKKRKYKLVEVVLLEDGQEEDQEGNETTLELGSEDQEFLNIESGATSDKTRLIQNSKLFKNKNMSKKHKILEEEENNETACEDNCLNKSEETPEPELCENTSAEIDDFSGRYVDQVEESCQRLLEDPKHEVSKKLILYVVEEEINGQVRKRVISEEDGVTMSEVIDLLKDTSDMAIPEE